MHFIQGFLTNKLLAAILAALILGFGGVFLHWQQEANEKEQANKQALEEAIKGNHAALESAAAEIKANNKRPADSW